LAFKLHRCCFCWLEPAAASHFFDTWPNVVDEYSVATRFDERSLPEYQAAKKTGSLAYAEPRINPDTGYPVISLMFPIIRSCEFVGGIGANLTLDLLSRFLERQRVSLNSITVIADLTDGQIIAYPEKQKEVRTVHDHLIVATLSTDNGCESASGSTARTYWLAISVHRSG
jgi:hypothetical protein